MKQIPGVQTTNHCQELRREGIEQQSKPEDLPTDIHCSLSEERQMWLEYLFQPVFFNAFLCRNDNNTICHI